MFYSKNSCIGSCMALIGALVGLAFTLLACGMLAALLLGYYITIIDNV